EDRSDRLAVVLEERGATAGVPVAAVLPNGIEFFETSMAAAKLDAPFLPVNWHLKPEEVAYIVADAGVSVVIDGDYEAALAAVEDAPSRDRAAGPSLVF